ncbi:MAG TPA: hypothetical protein VK762_37160 [Polyangiaceae bacterium]|nr:hypothetical protein [Polyangiaceae bacterium]
MAPLEHRTGAPPRCDEAFLDAPEREDRGVEGVAQLVSEDAEPLRSFVGDRPLPLPRKRGHGARRGVVQAEVEGLEIAGVDRGLLFNGEAGDDLAEVTVGIDDARYRQTFVKKMVTMLAGAVLDLCVVNDLVQLCLAEGVAELIEENRKPMREFRFLREWGASQGDPRSGLREDLPPIRCKELAEHGDNVRRAETEARFGAR